MRSESSNEFPLQHVTNENEADSFHTKVLNHPNSSHTKGSVVAVVGSSR